MVRIITFDEYVDIEFKRRLAVVRKWLSLETDAEALALDLPLKEYLDIIAQLRGLALKNTAITEQDLPSYLHGKDTILIPLGEQVKYQNLAMVNGGLDYLFVGDNYGIVIVGSTPDLRQQIDLDLQANSQIKGKYQLGNIETRVMEVPDFDTAKPVRCNVTERGFSIIKSSSPIEKHIKGLHWSQVTPEQSAELRYEEEINPDVSFYVQHRAVEPCNMVVISVHGVTLGIADVISFFGNYVQDKGYLAHFQAGVKPSPNWPGVLYDPSKK